MQSNSNYSSIGGGGDQSKDVIDEHLFIEALALAAFEVQFKEPGPSNIEKVFFLFFNQIRLS